MGDRSKIWLGRIIAPLLGATVAFVVGTTPATAHDYTVEEGDTLSGIAAEWEVPGGWQSIQEWNPGKIDNPNLIYPGQTFHLKEHRYIGDGNGGGSSSGGGGGDTTNQSADNATSTGGGKARPATGPITSHYQGGYRRNGGHSGTDFDGTDGNVYAAADGTVEAGFWDGAYGNKLVIAHGGGVETWYAHLSSFSVSAGQRVSAGQKVGNIGSTGNTTGPHLHFEVRVNGNMTDPLAWLD